MKTEPKISPPETVLLPESQSETTETPKSKRRPRGKIANLPKVLRDRVNAMLDDGLTYDDYFRKPRRPKNPDAPNPERAKPISASSW